MAVKEIPEEEIVAVNIRMPLSLRNGLKKVYWQAAGKHQLSYNAWLVRELERIGRRSKS